ncbi:hypothetical protein D6D54_02955 [Spiroplasma poulsonii]|uniref:Uncharacterized protein n=1 Tax=Spiroplasma poulsonii TaxID=2138 RepID=A0A433ES56_9MOLU|nr:hypothetical protein [Spiroplasma poulsonii]MBW3058361.1 hypothetical protein [Spiroplasma poulsonii]RUP77532.1 hypothetical protein D6D54_02955 [Spiroplasma poulsonii]
MNKKIPKAKKYTTFILTGLGERSEGWAEGSSFKTQTSKAWVNLIVNDTNGAPLRGIPLTNGTELNNKNIGGTWYTNDKKTYATAYGELFLDFKFINNTINAKLRAKATAFNPTFLGWTKTQTKFKFKIMVI